jgi:hypothetical protein
MNKLHLLLALPFFFSCGENSGSDNDKNFDFSYSIDTVMIDPKDQIINISLTLGNSSAVSPDTKSFFFFDRDRTLLQEVDLEKLELVGNYQFAKDGPNSVGFNPPQIQTLADDRFLIVSNGINVGVFNKQGIKEKGLKFNFKEIEGLDGDEEGLITHKATLSPNQKYLFALSALNPSLDEVKLFSINPELKTGKEILLPIMKQALEYTLLLKMPKRFARWQETIDLQIFKDQLLISSKATSDIYRYDYERDSLVLTEFPHQLVPIRKTGQVKNIFDNQEEFESEVEKVMYQINFGKLIWDNTRKMFFRFGNIPIPSADGQGFTKSKVYLFVYDENLSLLAEKYLSELTTVPSDPFFKDGKLWSYVNVEDELGFAVFTFNF